MQGIIKCGCTILFYFLSRGCSQESQDLEKGLEEGDLQARIYPEGTSAEPTLSGLCTGLVCDLWGLSAGMAPAYTLVAPRGSGEGSCSSPIILFSTSLKEAHFDQSSECAGQMRLQGKSSGAPRPG